MAWFVSNWQWLATLYLAMAIVFMLMVDNSWEYDPYD